MKVWQFLKDILLSGAVALAILWTAFVGLMNANTRLRIPHSRPHRVRTQQIMKATMEFVLVPVEKPRKLVPGFLRNIPVVGSSIVTGLTVVTFPPCFWTIVAFCGIRLKRWAARPPAAHECAATST